MPFIGWVFPLFVMLAACGSVARTQKAVDNGGDTVRDFQTQEEIFAAKLQANEEEAEKQNTIEGVEQNPDGTLYYQPPDITVIVPTVTPIPNDVPSHHGTRPPNGQ